MDLIRDLVGGGGGGSCAADGTAAAANPISSLVNTLVRGNDMTTSKRPGDETCGLTSQDPGYNPSSLELEMTRGAEWMSSHPTAQMQPMPPGIHPAQSGLRHPLSLRHCSSFSTMPVGPQNDTTSALSERESDSWACEYPGHIKGIAQLPSQHVHLHTMPLAWRQACLEHARIAEEGGSFMSHPIPTMGPPWMAPILPCTDPCLPPLPPHSLPFSSPAFFHGPVPRRMGAMSERAASHRSQRGAVHQQVNDQLVDDQRGVEEENTNAAEDMWMTGSPGQEWAGLDGIEGCVVRRPDNGSSTVIPDGITTPSELCQVGVLVTPLKYACIEIHLECNLTTGMLPKICHEIIHLLFLKPLFPLLNFVFPVRRRSCAWKLHGRRHSGVKVGQLSLERRQNAYGIRRKCQ